MTKYLLNVQQVPGMFAESEETIKAMGLPRWFDSIDEMFALAEAHGVCGLNLASRTYVVPDGEEPDENKHRLIGHFCLMRADPYSEGDYDY
jgi:hypothetical protein